MASLTLRDVPDDVLKKMRILSERERRSLNKEFLVIVEEGLEAHLSGAPGRTPDDAIPPETQAALWDGLAGRWKDSRSTRQIVNDLRRSRTQGREVQL